MAYCKVMGQPQGKARARTVRHGNYVRSYTPKKTADYEQTIRDAFIKEDNESYMDGQPLRMYIKAFYEIPKSARKKDIPLMLRGEIQPTKKPDADNIAKVVCDALNGVAYHDDAQIINLTIMKRYDHEPRVEVWVEEVVF